MSKIKIGLAQLHPILGDIQTNTKQILHKIELAQKEDTEVIVFGELSITGYPPEDLVFNKKFIEQNLAALDQIAEQTADITAIVGFIDKDPDGSSIYNAAAICSNGKIQGTYRKHHLPNYSVFDEKRYFKRGTKTPVWKINGTIIGVTICEDIWESNSPAIKMVEKGAELIITINGSPFHEDAQQERSDTIKSIIKQTRTPLIYTNLVGGQDEIVFDGNSTIYSHEAKPIFKLNSFSEELGFYDLELGQQTNEKQTIEIHNIDQNNEIWEALKLGLKSYVQDNGFNTICLGLSGGIDSAITAVIAAEALGKENVKAILMPSKYSSDHSVSDALELCENLGIQSYTVPINPAHDSFLKIFEDPFGSGALGLTEENLQSRLRGLTLMAFSNRFGWLVAATGNKSELAVGYSTLYGDTVGAYGVIKDVWKTKVFELANWYNDKNGTQIPENTITKPPSAELREDQTDQQSLPPYEVLDEILKKYVEEDLSFDEIVEDGFEENLVTKIITLVNRAEYKRRQCPIGTRITKKAFGKDRRIPITNLYG